MATTLTATTYSKPVMRNATGVNIITGVFQYNGSTVSASHIVFLGKIPNGSTIVEAYLAGTSSNAADVWKFGITGSESAISAAATLSATAQRVSSVLTPFKVSLSDSANPQNVTVYLTHTSGTATATGSLSYYIAYVSNPGAGGI